MVRLGGLEPPTSGATNQRSNQLSYNRMTCLVGWRGSYGQSAVISRATKPKRPPLCRKGETAVQKGKPLGKKEKGRGEEIPAFSYARPVGGGYRSAGPQFGWEEEFRPAG